MGVRPGICDYDIGIQQGRDERPIGMMVLGLLFLLFWIVKATPQAAAQPA